MMQCATITQRNDESFYDDVFSAHLPPFVSESTLHQFQFTKRKGES